MPEVNNVQGYNVPLLSPTATTVLLSIASMPLIGRNNGRRGIVFSNPGTVNLYICPANIPAVIGQGLQLFPGAVLPLYGDGRLINYTCGWNGIAESGSNNPITMLELV